MDTKVKKLSKREIIQKVKNHYNSNNRAVKENGACRYLTGDGRKCAVGMFLNDEGIRRLKDFICGVGRIEQMTEKTLDEFLIEEVRGYGTSFWAELQSLHDTSIFWDKKGISLQGENFGKRAFRDDWD